MIWAFYVREEHAGPRFAERFHLAGRAQELLIRPIGRSVYLLATLHDVLQQNSADADRSPEPSTA